MFSRNIGRSNNKGRLRAQIHPDAERDGYCVLRILLNFPQRLVDHFFDVFTFLFSQRRLQSLS